MKWPIIFLPLALASCEREKPVSRMPREQAVKLAREAAQDAFTQLSGELAKAIESGGPVAAIPVCSGKAGSIVAEVAAKRQLAMVRLSDRPRNPTQAARDPISPPWKPSGPQSGAVKRRRRSTKRWRMDPPCCAFRSL